MTDIRFLARVLAYALADNAEQAERVLALAGQEEREACERAEAVRQSDIDECYALYPSHDINNSNRCTGKCSKDKEKLRAFIAQCGKDHVMSYIKAYVEVCARERRWLLNFGTFLNQKPEVNETSEREEDSIYK